MEIVETSHVILPRIFSLPYFVFSLFSQLNSGNTLLMDSSSHAQARMRDLDAKIRILTTFAHRSYTTKTSSEARRSELTDIRPVLVGHTLGHDAHFGRMTRTAYLLDSLAQICVSEKEVYAVALAVHGSQPASLKLVFAANGGVTDATAAYLNNFRGSLVELANAVTMKVEAPQAAPSPQLFSGWAMGGDIEGKLSFPIRDIIKTSYCII